MILYYKINNGLILQYAQHVVSPGGNNYTFPTSFTINQPIVQLQRFTGSNATDSAYLLYRATDNRKTTYNIYFSGNSNTGVRMFAIGY